MCKWIIISLAGPLNNSALKTKLLCLMNDCLNYFNGQLQKTNLSICTDSLSVRLKAAVWSRGRWALTTSAKCLFKQNLLERAQSPWLDCTMQIKWTCNLSVEYKWEVQYHDYPITQFDIWYLRRAVNEYFQPDWFLFFCDLWHSGATVINIVSVHFL